MNVNPVQFFNKKLPQGAYRICAIICIFLLTAVPALADPVTSRQVVQTLNSSQGALDIRINKLATQDPATTKSGAQQNGPRAEGSQGTQPDITRTESIIAGVAITSEGQQLGVDYEEGEVEGTICDCGEIPPIMGGGFPKWPFLFLAAVPLAFIHDCDNCDEQNESPTPNPTPTPPSEPTPSPTPPGVPEPGTLVLFGSGLAAAGAGLRRRYAKMKLTRQIQEEE
jgi:PEP-CTERM motif